MAPSGRRSRSERVLELSDSVVEDTVVEDESVSPTTYRFVKSVDYDPNGRHYEVDEVDSLEDWNPDHIHNALVSGLIRKEV